MFQVNQLFSSKSTIFAKQFLGYRLLKKQFMPLGFLSLDCVTIPESFGLATKSASKGKKTQST